MDSATTTQPRDAAALLKDLADIGGKLSDMHHDAVRLGLPQAVSMGLLWLRDDAQAVFTDALVSRRAEG
jgi:hypothetical protein